MNKVKKVFKLKQNKGITGIDIVVSLIIISMFTGVVANLMYKSYSRNFEVLKNANASAYATMVLEKIDEKSFNEVDNDFLTTFDDEITYDNDYAMELEVIDKGNSAKNVKLTISYKNEELLTINKIKIKE